MTVETAQIDHWLQKRLGRCSFAIQEKPRRRFVQENRKRHVHFGSKPHTNLMGLASQNR
jgi:hypothetical protein